MKNTTILNLESQITLTESRKVDLCKPFNDRIEALNKSLSQAWDKVFNNDPVISQALSAVESSTNYGIEEFGLYSWLRFDASAYKQAGCLDQLERYISEHGMTLDLEHDALMNFQGDYIGINEDGEIYHDDMGHVTWIATRKDYETTSERNALIEAYMDKSGVYPGVFNVDRYGNIHFVNTQLKIA